MVSTKLAFGLLNQPKWIPLRYAPLTLELELVNSFADVIIMPDGDRFTDATVSKEWSIQQVEVKCDVCTLDNALENSYEAHLLDKGTLPINYNTYINRSQNISGQVEIAINVSRAIIRLKSIFFNLSKKSSENRIVLHRTAANALTNYDNGSIANLGDINKPWNGFIIQ